MNGEPTLLGVYAMDVPRIPILLGIRTLCKLGAILDLSHDTVEFRKIFPGTKISLIRDKNGHLLLDLCSDWVTSKGVNCIDMSLQQALTFESLGRNDEPNAAVASCESNIHSASHLEVAKDASQLQDSMQSHEAQHASDHSFHTERTGDVEVLMGKTG